MQSFMKTAAVAALLTGVSGAAHATEGWYARLDGGYSFEATIDVTGLGETDLTEDWMASGGFGYAFPGLFRLEGELSYRNNETDLLPPEEIKVFADMVNAYLDFSRHGPIQPYVGVGVGYGNLDIDGFIEEGGYALQGMAGIGFAVGERATIDLGYRYFTLPEVEFPGATAEYIHQAGTIGLRWQFSAPPAPPLPPPPPPAPEPPPPVQQAPAAVACPTADFVVYFEWDRSNLNQAALETIDLAVNQARACNLEAVLVIGHTDTSGATQYNAGLSDRRASVVRDALTARGIAATSVRSEGRGETDLARATRDGVREPLNRRAAVTITFRP